MEEWKTYRIGDICESVSDTYRRGSASVVLVNTSDVLDGVCLNHTRVQNKDLKGQFKKTFKKDDILYSEIRPANKRFAYIDFDPIDYIASTKLMVIRSSDKVRPRYLYHFLKRQEMLDELQALAESRSGTFPQITFSELALFEIKLPSLETQDRIVAAIDSFEYKIALNNRINHNLEEQAQALYKSWFVDFEPFKEGEFVDSELGLIPEGWRVGTLSELGDIVAGGTPSKTKPEYYTNNGIAWLTPKDLSVKCNKFTARGEIDITEDGYKNSSAKLMPRGSVLFSSRAPIGYISIAKGDICTNQGFKSVVPTYAGTAYLYYWLCENTEAIEAQASGSTFKEASGSLMRSFPALVPEKSVIDSFEKELSPILNEQEILEEEINHAEQIRDSLLPRLMSGELVMNC